MLTKIILLILIYFLIEIIILILKPKLNIKNEFKFNEILKNKILGWHQKKNKVFLLFPSI